MATYITTARFSEQGIRGAHETRQRAAAFKAAAKKMGVKVTSIYWTLGPFDGVLIFEAPDDETATAAMLQMGMRGNVQTTTCRAFDDAEMEKILSMIKPTNSAR
jgi:uncharacterized protein with GYD domain